MSEPINKFHKPKDRINKPSWIEKILCRIFDYKVIINCVKDPYLIRWYLIRNRWFALFLHKFVRSDEDRALHDHPWNFIVMPIWQGYTEYYEELLSCPACGGQTGVECLKCSNAKLAIVKTHRARLFIPIYRRAEWAHRVQLDPCDNYSEDFDTEDDCPTCKGTCCKPSWSLFMRFSERRVWGFWNPVSWGKYVFQQWNDWNKERCE